MALAAGGALHKAVDADRRSRQALQRWQRVGDAGETRLLARAQLLLGQALATRGENDEARQSLQQSVELCRKIEAGPEDPVLQAALLALARLADG
jgi:predicted ATPase